MSEKQYGLYDAGNDVDDIKVLCERVAHLMQLLHELTESEFSALDSLSCGNKTLVWVAARLNVIKALTDTIYFESENVAQEAGKASRKIWEAVQNQANSQTLAKME